MLLGNFVYIAAFVRIVTLDKTQDTHGTGTVDTEQLDLFVAVFVAVIPRRHLSWNDSLSKRNDSVISRGSLFSMMKRTVVTNEFFTFAAIDFGFWDVSRFAIGFKFASTEATRASVVRSCDFHHLNQILNEEIFRNGSDTFVW